MSTDFELRIPQLTQGKTPRRGAAEIADFSVPELGVAVSPCLTPRTTPTTDSLHAGAGCVDTKDSKLATPQHNTTANVMSPSGITNAAPTTMNGADGESPLINVKEFAAKLSCCPTHIRRMADSGRCPPAIRLGGCHRWSRQVVDDWIAAGCPVVRQPRTCGRRK
jgi:predicted DNA-binding transcriptional regulator AlpA